MADSTNGSSANVRKEEPESIKSYYYPDRDAKPKHLQSAYSVIAWSVMRATLLLVPLLVLLSSFVVARQQQDLLRLFEDVTRDIQGITDQRSFWLIVLSAVGAVVVLFFGLTVYYMKRPRPVYLVDFACFQPPEWCKVPHDRVMEVLGGVENYTKETLEFQERLLARNGLGHETYFPPGVLAIPPDLSMQAARDEAMLVMTGCLDELFASTGLKPRDVDFLIVNCSLFNPTPSLSAMVINHYKMRSNIINYNLAGMGCSAGVVSIDLAKDLLQVHPDSNVVVISTENITQNWYLGNEKKMLLSNTLFRMGGACMLLTNKSRDAARAKYRLLHTVRVHKGAHEASYRSVFQEEDCGGLKGVSLSKELMNVAGDALKTNLTILGPLVLPWSEQIKFLMNVCLRKYEAFSKKQKRTAAYVPDFKKAFQHFCIHAGGRAIIDAMEQNLKLGPQDVEPSRATLYRYGNTSSSSIWYEMQFVERSGRLKKGDKIFQIALGSGFKCNSAVWLRLRR